MNYVEDRIPEPTQAQASLLVVFLAFIFGFMHHNRQQKSSLLNSISLSTIYLLMWSLGALISWLFGQLPVVFSTNNFIITSCGAIPLVLCWIFWNQLRTKPVWLAGRFVLAGALYLIGIHIAETQKQVVWANQLEYAPSFTAEEHILILARWSLVSLLVVNLLFFMTFKISGMVAYALLIPEVAVLTEVLQSAGLTHYLTNILSQNPPPNEPSAPNNGFVSEQGRQEVAPPPQIVSSIIPRDAIDESIVRHRLIAEYWEEQKTLVGPLSPLLGYCIAVPLAILGFASSFSSYSYVVTPLVNTMVSFPLWILPLCGACIALNSIHEGEPIPEDIERWLKVPPGRRKRLE